MVPLQFVCLVWIYSNWKCKNTLNLFPEDKSRNAVLNKWNRTDPRPGTDWRESFEQPGSPVLLNLNLASLRENDNALDSLSLSFLPHSASLCLHHITDMQGCWQELFPRTLLLFLAFSSSTYCIFQPRVLFSPHVLLPPTCSSSNKTTIQSHCCSLLSHQLAAIFSSFNCNHSHTYSTHSHAD